MFLNGANVVGYIPVLGAAAGALRIYATVVDKDKAAGVSTAAKVLMVVRAIFEILGAGLIFLIPDLIVTARRAIHQRMQQKTQYNQIKVEE